MFNDKAKSTDQAAASISAGGGAKDKVKAGGVFRIQCRDREGNIKWEEQSHNLVVNEGLQDMNAKYFTGSGYTALWYLGLYGPAASNNPSAGDTMLSHGGWTEVTSYSQATRPQCVFGTPTTADPSVATNSASPAIYSINGTMTVGGAFFDQQQHQGRHYGYLVLRCGFQLSR